MVQAGVVQGGKPRWTGHSSNATYLVLLNLTRSDTQSVEMISGCSSHTCFAVVVRELNNLRSDKQCEVCSLLVKLRASALKLNFTVIGFPLTPKSSPVKYGESDPRVNSNWDERPHGAWEYVSFCTRSNWPET